MKKVILTLVSITLLAATHAAAGQKMYAFFKYAEAVKTLDDAKEAWRALFSKPEGPAAAKYFKPDNLVSHDLIREEYKLNLAQAFGLDPNIITDEMAKEAADSFHYSIVNTAEFYVNGITSPYVAPGQPDRIAGAWIPKNRDQEGMISLNNFPIFSTYCGQNPQVPLLPHQPISPDENPPVVQKDTLPDMSWTRTPISGGNSTSSASSSISAPVSYTYIAPPQQSSNSGSGIDFNTLLALEYLSNSNNRSQQQRQGTSFWAIAGGTALGSTIGTTAGNFFYDLLSGNRRRQNNNYFFQQRNNYTVRRGVRNNGGYYGHNGGNYFMNNNPYSGGLPYSPYNPYITSSQNYYSDGGGPRIPPNESNTWYQQSTPSNAGGGLFYDGTGIQ
jgi:hypothetical protein